MNHLILIEYDQLVNHWQPILRVVFTVMVPVNEQTVTFWRDHMAYVLPAQIVGEIYHCNVGISQRLFVVIDHSFKLVPEVAVLKRLDIFWNYATHIEHVWGVQLNVVYVDFVGEHFDSLVANFF